MDWKLFFMTFGAIFVAELADKTQLVSMIMRIHWMAAKHGKPYVIFGASVSAYVVVTALSVVLGSIAAKYVKPDVVRYTAAFLFVSMGVLIAFKKI